MASFRIKICGVTTVDDAQLAVDAGADALGLNFYTNSPRRVATETAEKIAAILPASVVKVGVFVNAPADEVRTLAERLPLDVIQLHGNEPPEFLASLNQFFVMRAFRPQNDATEVASYLARCRELGHMPGSLLIDAFDAAQFGGTGKTANWQIVAAIRSHFPEIPVVLAGGLSPANVASAIEAVRPAAVDTASGVESAPGQKSPELVRAFIQRAKHAFDLLDGSR